MFNFGFPGGASGKESACNAGDQEPEDPSLGGKDPLEEAMATHCSILAWISPWTEEPGGIQSMGLQRVRQDWVTKHIDTHMFSVRGFPGGSMVRNPPANAGHPGSIPGSGRSPGGTLVGGTPTHSSILARKISRTEEPGGLQSKGVTKQSDWVTENQAPAHI